MQNLLYVGIGVLLGIFLSYIAQNYKTYSKDTRAVVRIPNEIYEKVREIGQIFEWTPIETLRQLFRLGLLALIMYSKGEGGLYVNNDEGYPLLVELTGTNDLGDDNLGPFSSYIDKMNF